MATSAEQYWLKEPLRFQTPVGASNGQMNGGAHAITSHWKLISCDSRALVQNAMATKDTLQMK